MYLKLRDRLAHQRHGKGLHLVANQICVVTDVAGWRGRDGRKRIPPGLLQLHCLHTLTRNIGLAPFLAMLGTFWAWNNLQMTQGRGSAISISQDALSAQITTASECS